MCNYDYKWNKKLLVVNFNLKLIDTCIRMLLSIYLIVKTNNAYTLRPTKNYCVIYFNP